MATKPGPPELNDGALVKVGEGDREAKIGPLLIRVYSAAFYINEKAAAEPLGEYCSYSWDELVNNQEFYDALVAAKCAKCVRIIWNRALDKKRITDSLAGLLKPRVDPELLDTVTKFTGAIYPDKGPQENDILFINFAADGANVKVEKQLAGTSEPVVASEIANENLWRAFQNAYFDPNAEMKTLKQNFIREIPVLLSTCTETPNDDLSEEQMQRVASEVFTAPPTNTKSRSTWKDAAGRSGGKEGYKFGDFTRSILGRRKSNPSNAKCSTSPSEFASKGVDDKPTNEARASEAKAQAAAKALKEKELEIKDLRSKCTRLEKQAEAAKEELGDARILGAAFGFAAGVFIIILCVFFQNHRIVLTFLLVAVLTGVAHLAQIMKEKDLAAVKNK